MTLQARRDELARKTHGAKTTYNALSAWSRMDIDSTIAQEEQAKVVVEPIQEDSLQYRIATLQDQLAVAKKENNDLWEQNEELKMELERMRGNEE